MVLIEGNMKAEDYIAILRDVMIPMVTDLHNDSAIFQHDGAAVHTARVTKQFLSDNNISVLPFPAKSPDLNPIEKVWALWHVTCTRMHDISIA